MLSHTISLPEALIASICEAFFILHTIPIVASTVCIDNLWYKKTQEKEKL